MTSRLLLIDDDARLTTMVGDYLRRNGHEVDTAGSLAAGREQLKLRPYDALLLDLMLPDGDGLDLTRELRADPRTRRLPLLTFVALFHLSDAVATLASFVLRAWRIATVPLLVNTAALWGVGLGGGFVLAFNVGGWVPPAFQGAPGFWWAATAGLLLTALALSAFLARVMRRAQSPS